MDSSTLKMVDLSRLCTKMLPDYAHSAIICGQTGCGKTEFILDLLESRYRMHFNHIVILCPTLRWNKAYHSRPWIWKDPEIYLIDPGERLHDWIRAFYQMFAGEETLYIVDDCSANKALTQKKKTCCQNSHFLDDTQTRAYGC